MVMLDSPVITRMGCDRNIVVLTNRQCSYGITSSLCANSNAVKHRSSHYGSCQCGNQEVVSVIRNASCRPTSPANDHADFEAKCQPVCSNSGERAIRTRCNGSGYVSQCTARYSSSPSCRTQYGTDEVVISANRKLTVNCSVNRDNAMTTIRTLHGRVNLVGLVECFFLV